MDEDFYHTISAPSTGDFRDRGSKFIATASPCSSEEDLKSLIAEQKKLHPTSRHYCYAMVLGADGQEQRSSDDGEPSGTAGLPILNQILSSNLCNCAVVVVRYFGGTKLGKPGLINAYKESAKEALQSAKIKKVWITECVKITYGYDDTGAVMRAVESFPMAKIVEQNFAQTCEMTVSVPKSTLENALHLFDHLQHVSVKHIT